jgi:hypothetical protein
MKVTLPHVALIAATVLPALSRAPTALAAQAPATIAAILDEYRRGDADAAVDAFARWDARRVERDARLDEDADPWARAALALLHAEVATRVRGLNPYVQHYETSARLVEQLYRHATAVADVRLLAFCRRWHIMAVSLGNRAALEDTRERYPDDPNVLLQVGIWYERWMGPAPDESGPTDYGMLIEGPIFDTSHGRFGRHAYDAERTFRRALTLDAGLLEARLRLGRVLYLLDRADDARAEFERIRAEARDPRDDAVRYLASLFLGQLHEKAGRSSAAAEAYRAAIAVNAAWPAARLALGRLLIVRGAAGEGWRAASRVFDEDAAAGTTVDPSVLYQPGPGQWWRAPVLAREMRTLVRQ